MSILEPVTMTSLGVAAPMAWRAFRWAQDFLGQMHQNSVARASEANIQAVLQQHLPGRRSDMMSLFIWVSMLTIAGIGIPLAFAAEQFSAAPALGVLGGFVFAARKHLLG